MKQLFARFISEEEGQDLIEYALLAALLSIAVILIMTNLGDSIRSQFTTINSTLNSGS